MSEKELDRAGVLARVASTWNDSQHPATLFTADPSLGYFPSGALRKGKLGNGLTETNVYDSRLNPCLLDLNNSDITLQTCNDSTPTGNVLDLWYGYNAGSSDNGNVVNWNATGDQSFIRVFGYDSLNRVSTMSDTASGASCTGLSWTYDAWGNRNAQSATGGTCNTFSQTADANNRLPASSGYQYDAAGNMTYDGTHYYFYDAESRLIQVDGTSGNCSTATACYIYDAFGRRVKRTVGSYSAEYVYDTAGQLDTVFGDGHFEREYVHLNGGPLVEYYNNATYFVHTDHLGSTRLLTGYPTPSVVECDDYYPFGELIACGGSSETTEKFTGYERDAETNLDNAQARYNSSTMGRFMSPDPENAGADISDPQTLNMYSYVENNPLNLTDPTGMQQSGGNEPAASCNGTGTGFEECLGAYFNCAYIQTCNPNNPSTWPPPHDVGLCTAGNIQVDCEYVFDALHADAAELCPDNNCHLLRFDSNGNLQRWVAPTPPPPGPCSSTTICQQVNKQISSGKWETVDTEDMRLKITIGLIGTLADRQFKSAVVNMAVNDAVVAGGSVVVDLAKGPLQSTLFGRFATAQGGGFPGLLNDPSYPVRIGYGWTGKQNVFRMAWDWFGGGHFDLWRF